MAFNLASKRLSVVKTATEELLNEPSVLQQPQPSVSMPVTPPAAQPNVAIPPYLAEWNRRIKNPQKQQQVAAMHAAIAIWAEKAATYPANPLVAAGPPNPQWLSDFSIDLGAEENLDDMWQQRDDFAPTPSHSLMPIALFSQTVRQVLKSKGWSVPMVERLLRDVRGSGPEKAETGREKLKQSVINQEPHSQAFAAMMNEILLRDKDLAHQFGMSGIPSPEQSRALTDAMFAAFGLRDSGKGHNDIDYFWSIPDNRRFAPRNVRGMLKGLDQTMMKRMLDSDPEMQQKLKDRIEAASLYFTPPSPNTSADPKDEADAKDHELVDTFNKNPAFAADFKNAMINRLNTDYRSRLRIYQLQVNDRKSSSLDNTNDENASLGDKVTGDKVTGAHVGIGDAQQNVRQNQMDDTTDEQQINERARRVGSQLQGVADQIRQLGHDVSAYVRINPHTHGSPSETSLNAIPRSGKPDETYGDKGVPQYWPPRGSDKKLVEWVIQHKLKGKAPSSSDPAKLQQQVDRLNRLVQETKDEQGSLNRDNYTAAFKIRTYADAISAALKEMSDPASEKGRQDLNALVGKMISREQGTRGGNSIGDWNRPDRIPPLVQPGQKPNTSDVPEGDKLWDASTGYTPGGVDDVSASSSNVRAELYQIVGNEQFKHIIQQKVDSMLSRNYAPGVTERIQQDVLTQKKPKDEMRTDLGLWGPFMLLDEVQDRYSPIVRRLFMDLMPLRSELGSGKGIHSSNSPLYYAARGELQNTPSAIGHDDKKPGKTQPPEDTLAQIHRWKEQAKANLARKGIKGRWKRMDEAKHQAYSLKRTILAMASKNVMFKAAGVDISYIDRLIFNIESAMARESDLFFHLLRAA